MQSTSATLARRALWPALLSLSVLALSACGTLLAPSEADMASKAVVEYGQPLPAGDDFIVHFPAHRPLPVHLLVDGSLFEQGADSSPTVVLRRDVFSYRRFASFDMRHWESGNRLIASQLKIDIPARDGSSAGLIHLQMDAQ